MKQVVFIGGGDSYTKRKDFLSSLEIRELRNPRGEESKFWSATFREALGQDYELFNIRMPNTDNAQYDEWKVWFTRHLDYLGTDLVLVGWSLGGMFLAKYLAEENFEKNIKGLFLIAAPAGYYDDGQGNDCGSFTFDLRLVQKVANISSKTYILHSKDDFIVPFEHGKQLHESIPGSEFLVFEDKNHFLIEDFPELIKHIQNLEAE